MGQDMMRMSQKLKQKNDCLEVHKFTDKFHIKVYGVESKSTESES